MLFNSLQFAVFLPVVFTLYWLIPHRFRWILLLASSYYFYMGWNAKYVFLILFTTVASYCAGLGLEKAATKKAKKAILAGTLAACLGVLFVFKYLDFFFNTVTAVCSLFAIRLSPLTVKILLPVGISFYTFQTLSYVIDVYRGTVPAEHHFGIYATFVSFFPQLVAGPIERTGNLLHQIREEHVFNYHQATYGLKLMAWGFFKKMVVADNLAVYVDRVYNNLPENSGLSLFIATAFAMMQIYCDFSGYSDIARGASKLMGIELMENFKSPFFSTSIKQLWGRWHLSLTTWFRDYVYFPLGGNRVSKIRHYFNLLVTFMLSGLWHGANWTFVIWGGLSAVGQIIEEILKIKPNKKQGSFWWFVRAGLVYLFLCAIAVFFRAQNLQEVGYIYAHVFDGIGNIRHYIGSGILALGLDKVSFLWRCALYFVPVGIFDYYSLKTDVIDWVGERRPVIRHGIYILLIALITIFHAYGEVNFVYFQF